MTLHSAQTVRRVTDIRDRLLRVVIGPSSLQPRIESVSGAARLGEEDRFARWGSVGILSELPPAASPVALGRVDASVFGEAWKHGRPVRDVSDHCTSCRVSPAGLGGDPGRAAIASQAVASHCD
jgi:hypothetical protein